MEKYDIHIINWYLTAKVGNGRVEIVVGHYVLPDENEWDLTQFC